MINFFNIIKIALKSIMKNKRRNIFTMIGIIIGISSVILIMSLGNGFKKTATEQFSKSGKDMNTSTISYIADGVSAPKENPFSETDISIVKRIEGVENAKIKQDNDQSYSTQIDNHTKNKKVSISTKTKLEKTAKGHGITLSDNDLSRKIVVINQKVNKDVFNNKGLNETLYINNQGFEIVGISDESPDESLIFMPRKTFNRYMSELNQEIPQLEVILNKGSDKKRVSNIIKNELNSYGSAKGNGKYQYSDMEEFTKSIEKVFDSITYFVAAVAGISLFIAGVGVMNVMYISVAERTEEIAIRRAFGAKKRDIELQFLVESIVLCLIGGIIGLTIGASLGELIELLTPDYIKSITSLGSILLVFGVSTFIGIIFGIIPARSAAKKELIDIIR